MHLANPNSVEHSYGLTNSNAKCHCGHAFEEGERVYQVEGSPYPINWAESLVYFCARCLKREGLIW